MFSNVLTKDSSSSSAFGEKSKSIYHKFQNLLGRGSATPKQERIMESARDTIPDENFMTPVSSVDDLMALSPRRKDDQGNITGELLGAKFDSMCDVTMHDAPLCDDDVFNATSLDYLVKCAESNRKRNIIDRGKESLFVKFDPLYSKQRLPFHSPSRTESADSAEGDIGYETGSTTSFYTDDQVSLIKHSKSDCSDMPLNNNKPTQIVPPVISSDVSKFNQARPQSTPVLVRSVSVILPPTRVATDRLVNIGETPPSSSHSFCHYETSKEDRIESLKTILQKQDNEIFQLRQENRELKSNLHSEKQNVQELTERLQKNLDEKSQLMERVIKLTQLVNEKSLNNKQMSIVMEEYEKTISSLIAEEQKEKKQYLDMKENLTMERDQVLNHLASMESSFNDLLAKYEKCKHVIADCKDTEKILKEKISQYEDGLKKYEDLYENLKKVTSESLTKANDTLHATQKNHSIEIRKLNAIIKKNEITISSLQESLTQKTRDNEELTRICDQLISEVR